MIERLRPSDQLLRRHDALVVRSSTFQRRARLLQTLWRAEQGFPIGLHHGKPLGSRLEMPLAKEGLANYLTERIRDVVKAEVQDPARAAGKLYGKPRIFNDLLSSQPLCFNLFGELQRNLDAATQVFRRLCPARVQTVTAIQFEHSPGRGDARFTGDRSAFDVFIEYDGPSSRRGFIGIEVKYHESLKDKAGRHRSRYDEVAAAMGVFQTARLPELRNQPLQQIWRDHLLAGSLVEARVGYDEGAFAFLYPAQNTNCLDATMTYRNCLRPDASGFLVWTLESFVEELRAVCVEDWVRAFTDRYLAFEKVDDLCQQADATA